MKTNLTTNSQRILAASTLHRLNGLMWFCAMLGFVMNTEAQTPVCGNISGTWTPAGNPYIIACDSTVPSGQTLTIQPGVVVWLGSNVTLAANGLIQAVGTPSQRIKFQSPVSSQYWNSISLIHQSGTNRFNYCDFVNGDTAISMGVYGANATMIAEVMNCTFSNCISGAIYGVSQGTTFPIGSATLDPIIKNCVFESLSNACVMRIIQDGFGFRGYANPKIIGNVFRNLTGSAFLMVTESDGSSQPIFLNNTLINCRTGVASQEPWDAKVQSCIFVGCSNAVMRSGSLSTAASYNNFFANATNFTGYPGTYGVPIIVNRNGTASDLLFNIFQDPLFVGANDYHLTASSTCIDAGVGDPANFDSCFPPSLGSVTNDIGAYGGPGGCEWISPPATNIFTVAIAQYVGVTLNPPTNGHYRLEYASVLSGTNNWIQLTNLTLSAPFIYYDPVVSGSRFYRGVLLGP